MHYVESTRDVVLQRMTIGEDDTAIGSTAKTAIGPLTKIVFSGSTTNDSPSHATGWSITGVPESFPKKSCCKILPRSALPTLGK